MPQGTKLLDEILTFYGALLCSFLFSMNLKLSDIARFRTNKLSDKIFSESLFVRKFSILMYADFEGGDHNSEFAERHTFDG